MYVAYKNRTQTIKSYARAPHLRLGAFATIYKKLLLSYLNNLSRRIMTQCWQCATTTENMYSEWFHNYLLFYAFKRKNASTIFYIKRICSKTRHIERVAIEKKITIEYLP